MLFLVLFGSMVIILVFFMSLIIVGFSWGSFAFFYIFNKRCDEGIHNIREEHLVDDKSDRENNDCRKMG